MNLESQPYEAPTICQAERLALSSQFARSPQYIPQPSAVRRIGSGTGYTWSTFWERHSELFGLSGFIVKGLGLELQLACLSQLGGFWCEVVLGNLHRPGSILGELTRAKLDESGEQVSGALQGWLLKPVMKTDPKTYYVNKPFRRF